MPDKRTLAVETKARIRGIAYLVAARAIESTMQPSLQHQSILESMWVQTISLVEVNVAVNQTPESDPPLR